MRRRRLFALLAAAPLAATVPSVAMQSSAGWALDALLAAAERHPGAAITFTVDANRIRWLCELAGRVVERGTSWSPEYLGRRFATLGRFS